MGKIKLSILTGGSSVEREVSLKSCENVLNNLDREKYDIHICTLPADGSSQWLNKLLSDEPDVVVSTLHGGIGENGSMQGLLHCLGIPYIGSKVFSSALCMDKKESKTVISANHIQVAPDIYIKRGESTALFADDVRQLGFPLIVKPNRGGSSIGIEIVNNIEELDKAVANIVKVYDDDVIAERFIRGKEITCCVYEENNCPEVMAVLEVNKKGDIFDYADKYERGVSSALSSMPSYMQDMVKSIAKKTFSLLKCRGYACVDMIVMEEQIYVIEVNTLPGLTENSIMPRACKDWRMTFAQLLDKLIEREIKK